MENKYFYNKVYVEIGQFKNEDCLYFFHFYECLRDAVNSKNLLIAVRRR